MRGIRRFDGGGLAGLLLLAGGALTLINNALPDNGGASVWVLDLVGGLALVLGAVSLRAPWHRLHPRTPLLLALAAFGLIAVSNAYGGDVNPFSFAVFFVVAFVWAGLAQPPGTSLALAVPATAAYLAPMILLPGYRHQLVQSVTIAVPVFVLVGEVLAWATRNHQRTAEQLRRRIRTVERMAWLSTEVSRDLDPQAVGQALADCAAAVFEGRAVFARVKGDRATMIAIRGLDPSYLHYEKPVAATSIGVAAQDPRRVAVHGPTNTTLPVPPGGSVATVACWSEGRLIGGVTVLLDRPPEEVDDEALDVLRVLGGQGEIALINADRHARLVEERRHDEAIVDVLVDGVIVLGPDGLVRSCNDAAATLLGWDADTLVGQPLPFGIEAGEVIENEIEPGLWIETRASALPATGETVMALRDVSRQHALDAAKDLFLATTSHELRTPLTAIKGYIATLQRHWPKLGEPERLRALAIVEEQTDSLVRLTDHLLLGARAATKPKAHVAYDLADLARITATAYAEVSPTHHIVADVPDGLPFAVGDPDSVRSVLAQLVENAVKYSPGGGEVRIVVRPDGPSAGHPDRLTVDVMDRGVGLPKDGPERLFEPFSQGVAPDTRDFNGVGLGLYIVRRLVESQGGDVTAVSRPGGGSTFRFTVPVAPVPAPRRTGGLHATLN
jgi:signal transduction histidine kinase